MGRREGETGRVVTEKVREWRWNLGLGSEDKPLVLGRRNIGGRSANKGFVDRDSKSVSLTQQV